MLKFRNPKSEIRNFLCSAIDCLNTRKDNHCSLVNFNLRCLNNLLCFHINQIGDNRTIGRYPIFVSE